MKSTTTFLILCLVCSGCLGYAKKFGEVEPAVNKEIPSSEFDAVIDEQIKNDPSEPVAEKEKKEGWYIPTKEVPDRNCAAEMTPDSSSRMLECPAKEKIDIKDFEL